MTQINFDYARFSISDELKKLEQKIIEIDDEIERLKDLKEEKCKKLTSICPHHCTYNEVWTDRYEITKLSTYCCVCHDELKCIEDYEEDYKGDNV